MSKIYLEKFICHNIAPFETDMNISFVENEIALISAVNGKGKTTLISYIVDAFYEVAKLGFHNEFKERKDSLYRISSPLYVLDNTLGAFVYIRFKKDGKNLDYVYVVNNVDGIEAQYNKHVCIDGKINFMAFKTMLEQNGFAKIVQCDNDALTETDVKEIFMNNVLTYFPSYRIDLPAWLNDVYKKYDVDFSRKPGFLGYLPNKIEVMPDINKLTNWMLDFVLDDLAYKIGVFKGKNHKNDSILNTLNAFMFFLLKQKGFGPNTTLSIGERYNAATRIAVQDRVTNKEYPNFYNMSSGELAFLGIFIELLVQIDKLYPVIELQKNNTLADATGIVVIDEIDKHLHITLQKEVLPLVMNVFPNIQFIITSHSPFVGIGLSKDERTWLVDLDSGGIITKPENTDVYEEVYNMMISENERFKHIYDRLLSDINQSNANVVVTEGKTDVMHLEKALEKLNIQDLNLTFVDVGDSFGESKLKTFLENISLVKNNHKIIGIFDRDVQSTTNEIEKDGKLFKSYGNNVYAFCLPALPNEKDHISIEHYYGDKAKTVCMGKRLFFGSEFSNKTIKFTKMYLDNTGRYLTYRIKDDKIQNDCVIDNNVYELNNDQEDVALSKIAFARDVIPTFEDFDWSVFAPIFERIRQIINL